MHNGVPAEGALVVFHPASPTATILPSAAVASDGSFSLVSDGQPGAPAGEYTVTIVWEKPGKRKEESTDKLKGKYSAPGTSKLRATIPAPGNQLPPFELN